MNNFRYASLKSGHSWLLLRCLLISFLLFCQNLQHTCWNIYNNFRLWRRIKFLVSSQSRSLLNKMIRHDILGFYSKKRFKTFLSCLYTSNNRHKVTITDCRNVLKYLPHSRGPEETCSTVISSANQIYGTMQLGTMI